MDHSFVARFGGVELEGLLPTLAKSKRARASLADALGAEEAKDGLQMLEAGDLTSPMWAAVHDFFIDEIPNEAVVVWTGHTNNDDDKDDTNQHYPMHVMEYEGVYFVHALEHDPAGYFLSLDAAEAYIFFNWTNVESDAD